MKTAAASLLLLGLLPRVAHAQSDAPSATSTSRVSATPVAPAQAPAQPVAVIPPSAVDRGAPYPQAAWSAGNVPVLTRRRGPRRVVDYRGGPIPMGMHLETRRPHGLVIAGAITFGASYIGGALSLAACSGIVTTSCTPGMGWLLVPVVGPFIAVGFAQTTESRALLVIDGVAQAAGLAMMLGGIFTARTVLVEDPYARNGPSRRVPPRVQWSVVPAGPVGTPGATFTLAVR
jgi:hypothetical protein